MSNNHDELTPEMEADVVRLAIQQRDLPHAAHHMAGLLASDPLSHAHLELFGQLAGLAGAELVELFPMSKGVWFGTAACRARALALAGEHAEAVSLLCRIAVAMPSVPYLVWARAWPLPSAEQVFASLQPLLQIEQEDTWKLALQTVVDRALAAYPEDAELAWLGSIGARRSGDLQRAVELAQRSVSSAPSWMGYVTLANAHRALSRWDETEQAWEAALRIDPEDASVLLDWGDTLFERRKHAEARERYSQALQRRPGQPWAEASIRYLDWMADPTTARWRDLSRWALQQGTGRARWARARATPWLGYLPPPTDATARALDQSASPVALGVSHLEGPSVLWAAVLAAPGITIQIGEIPDPDPREPLVETDWTLWTWEHTQPRPALAPPAADVAAAVGELAACDYDAELWLGRATRLAHELGPSAIDDLLAAALHPPRAPEGIGVHRWLWRVQHAAAFVLAAYPGWEGAHRNALWAMGGVRNDWLAIAALAAGLARAEADEHVAEDVLTLALTILKSPPGSGAFSTARAAWYAVLRLDPDDTLGLYEQAAGFLDAD